jgi:hypothetical protein
MRLVTGGGLQFEPRGVFLSLPSVGWLTPGLAVHRVSVFPFPLLCLLLPFYGLVASLPSWHCCCWLIVQGIIIIIIITGWVLLWVSAVAGCWCMGWCGLVGGGVRAGLPG